MASGEVKFTLSMDGGKVVEATIDGVTHSLDGMGEAATTAGGKGEKATNLWALNMKGVDAAMRATVASSDDLSKAAQKIMDRYDPLGTKLRALTSDLALMRREMGTASDTAAVNTFQGLEQEIEKTKALMGQAGVAGYEGFGKIEGGANKGMLATAGAKRELMVLAHEAMTGNFSKMPGSFMVLAERMSITEALLSPMVLGFVAVGAAAIALGVAYVKGSSESTEYAKSLAQTGNYAGVTKGQMADMAASISQVSGTQHEAADALAQMAASGRIGGDVLKEFSADAVDLEKNTGQAISATVAEFVKLGEQPVEASAKLNETLHYLTGSTYAQITALQRSGEVDAAAALAQRTYAEAMTSRGKDIVANLGYIQTALKVDVEWWGKFWDGAMGIGRGVTGSTQLEGLKKQLQAFQEKEVTHPSAHNEASISLLEGQIAYIERLTGQLEAQTKQKGDQAKLDERSILAQNQISASADQYATKQERLTAELRKQQIAYAAVRAAASPQDLLNPDSAVNGILEKEAEQLARIKDAYAETKKASDNEFVSDRTALQAWAKAMEEADAAISKASAKADGLSESERKLRDYLASSAAVIAEKLVPGSTALVEARFKQASATEKATAAQIEQEKISTTLWTAGAKGIETLDAQIQKQTVYNDQIGLTKAQIDELKSSRMEQSATDDEVYAGLLRETSLIAGEYAAAYIQYANDLDIIAAKKRQIAALDRNAATRDAAVQEAKDAAVEWKHTWDETNRFGQDAFVSWGMDGQNMAQKFGDALKKAALTAFYEASLKPIVLQVYTAFMGGGGSSVAGIGNTASGLSNMSGMGSSLMSWLTDFGSSATNALFKAGEFAYSKGFEGIGKMLMGDINTAGGFSAMSSNLQMVGNGLGYLSAVISASEGKWGAAIGAGLGTFFGGPIGSVIGSTIGGWIDKAFGGGSEYSVAQGLRIKAGADGLTSQNFNQWRNDGSSGFFGIGGAPSSSGTNYSATDAALQKQLSTAYDGIKDSTIAFAESLGLPTDAIKSFTADMTVNLTADAEANKKAVAKLFSDMADNMASQVLDPNLIREGETASSTLARLSVDLTVVNGTLSMLGTTLLDVSVKGAASADKLVTAFGGLEKFSTAASTFYANYYTKPEQDQKTLEGVQADLAKHGIDLSIDDLKGATADGVRAWVEAAKKLYDAGIFTADQLAAAINGANAIAPIVKDKPAPPPPPDPNAPPVDKWATLMGSHESAGTMGGLTAGGTGGTSGDDLKKFMDDFKKSVTVWMDKYQTTAAGGLDIFQQRTNAWASFQTQLTLAQAGDRDALGKILGTADTWIEAIKATSGSAFEQRLAIAKVQASVVGLVEQKPEQLVVNSVDRVNDTLLAGFAELTGQTMGGGGLAGSVVMGSGGSSGSGGASGSGGSAVPILAPSSGLSGGGRVPELTYMPPARTYSDSSGPVGGASGSSGGNGGGGNADLAAALRALADQLEAIEANTQSGAISGAKVARMFERVMPDSEEDVIAVQVVMPKGGFVPVRTV